MFKFSSRLPKECYVLAPGTEDVVRIRRGTSGYYETGFFGRNVCDRLNKELGVNKAQESAMLAGSMCGWDVPGADPAMYDNETGISKSVQKRHRKSAKKKGK